MSTIAKGQFVQDSWQTPRNARTLAAFMALRNREIGERITEMRKNTGGMPQEIVAHKLGVSNRSYQSWEAGDTKPSWRNLTKLAEFFGVSPEYILVGEELVQAIRPAESQLDHIEARLRELNERIGELSKLIDSDAITIAIQRAFEDYATRLGAIVGKRPPGSRRTADRLPAVPEAAA